jgi:FAD:protein FMN transferase
MMPSATAARALRVPLERALAVPAMGGTLTLRVAHAAGQEAAADAAMARVARRVDRWAARLTRFTTTSDLAALNADPARPLTPVRPTLAAVLDWSERAADRAEGWLDVTMLDERLGAEQLTSLPAAERDPEPRRWWLERRPRGAIVHRDGAFRFDLDGVAKGWIADRALELLRAWPAALVDADGDIAVRPGAGSDWHIAIADPRPDATDDLAVLRLDDRLPGGRVAAATSGTSVHRWADAPDGRPRHHLIDPHTRRPAYTDVVQATVIASSAREAEALAKAALIAGADAGFDLLDRSGARGAVLFLSSGETVALPRTLEWLV